MKLCTIDQAVLAAEKAGKEWKTVRGIRSRRQFLRVLKRARWRLGFLKSKSEPVSVSES